MEIRLDNKVAIVTGGRQGVGHAITERFLDLDDPGHDGPSHQQQPEQVGCDLAGRTTQQVPVHEGEVGGAHARWSATHSLTFS